MFKYDFDQVNKGYTDKTLYINLSDNKIISKPVPKETKDKFIGGQDMVSNTYGCCQG